MDVKLTAEVEQAVRQSQIFLQTVIDAIPDAMMVIGRDHRIVLANRVARELARGTDPVSGGLKCYQVSHHRDRPCEEHDDSCPLRQVLATKVPMTATHTHYDAQGRESFVEVTAAPVLDEGGEVACVIEFCRDVTDRKRSKNELEQERNLLRTLIDNLPDYIYVKDARSRFVTANLAVARIMGARSPNDLVGKTDRDFYPEELAAEYRADEQRLLRSGQPLINKDEPHLDPTGHPRTVLTTKVPLKDLQGQVVGLVGISRDITDRKLAEAAAQAAQQRILELERQQRQQAEAELDKLRDQLVRQTRLATIGQLSASVGHELKNPLGTIRNLLFLLKRKVPPDQAQWHDDLRLIDRELENAREIIDNLTAMSRGKPPVKTEVDLRAIVASARDRVDGPAGIEWHYACRPDPFLIRADALLLEQVFKNLFANSLHAIGGSGRIAVESTRSEAFDEIVVADTGPGIPADLQDRIFEPLVTKRPGGVGLGLAICRQIVERHGGSIELLAEDRPGAAFRIRLSIP